MSVRVLVLHGYSAQNKGDGLLVRETLELIKGAIEEPVEITLVSSYPDTFRDLELDFYVTSKPAGPRAFWKSLRVLASSRRFDLVVGVGGGYLRGGNCIEAAKTLVIHGPQLAAAAWAGHRTVYLPQSIGPFGKGSGIVARLLRRLGTVWVRDDRSLAQFSGTNVRRSPDLAVVSMVRRALPYGESALPVLTVRHLSGRMPVGIIELRERMGRIATYLQSSVGGNNDKAATSELRADETLSLEDFIESPQQSRIVVAVRLHAALMSLAAGHYVVHLSYERKGFGAFQDLGLEDFVFNVKDFRVSDVIAKYELLRNSAQARQAYDAAIAAALASKEECVSDLHRSLRDACNTPEKSLTRDSF